MMDPVIAWWSGGIVSAAACKLGINQYGLENVRLVFIDTKNEHPDTYRFKADCEAWYGKEIETIRNERWAEIQDVWFQYLSLNVATGAICSTELKRIARQQFIKKNPYSFQIFGYDDTEKTRMDGMLKNYYYLRPVFPTAFMSKQDCVDFVTSAGLKIPVPYLLGLRNNNCFQTGCVQGGVGYWDWMRLNEPAKFDAMAQIEHELTDLKGEPVTILVDQSNKQKRLVFLKPHPDYPDMKDITMMKGFKIQPLTECNGFCNKK